MTNIVSRTNECKLLQHIYDQMDTAFIAVYGRRRIGKTYLIKQFFKERGIYFQLTGSYDAKLTVQLHNFTTEFNDVFIDSQINHGVKNWQEAFDKLRRAIVDIRQHSNEKIILFFDELPWLSTPRSGFMEALEHCWNRYLADVPNVILIVCGSAASWMIKHIIRQKGGLHGRVTHKIHLKPFTLKETEEFLQSKKIDLTRKQIIDLYMALGGVAHYLKNIKQGMSATQIINEQCFSQHGALLNEFEDLYRSLFKNYQKHIKIVRALAQKMIGLTYHELIKATKLKSGGGMSTMLDELLAAGFIDQFDEYAKPKNKAKYRLVDEYSIFYLKWCESKDAATKDYWLYKQNSSDWQIWSGYTFENICSKHIESIKKALGIHAVLTTQHRWSLIGNHEKRGAQIDLLLDRNDQSINLFEIKYYNDKIVLSKTMLENLRNKKQIFIEANGIKKAVFVTLISPYGANENQYYREFIDNQLTADDLFLI